MGLLDFLKVTIGVDPGSQYLRIIKDGEIVFNEKSQILIERTGNMVTGFGNDISTTTGDITLKPVNYAIADFHGFELLLRKSIDKGLHSKSLFQMSYIMYYCIPTGSNEIEKRAYRDSAEHAGASEVYLVYQSCCSAISMNLFDEKRDFILIDFSPSKTGITVFANNIIISEGFIRMGTEKIFQLIKNYIRRKYKIEIRDKEVEYILNQLNKLDVEDELKIHYATIKAKEFQELLGNYFNLVNDEFIETIERVSNHPQIEKVIINGIYFTGGGSTIDYLRNKIKLDDKIKSTVSNNPFLDNIYGLKKILKDRERFKKYIMV